MATGVEGAATVQRSAFSVQRACADLGEHGPDARRSTLDAERLRGVPLPFASRRRAALVRDSGAFVAARPPAGRPLASESPRIAATANLDRPDAAPRALDPGTPRRDALGLALAFAIGIGGPAAWLVICALA